MQIFSLDQRWIESANSIRWQFAGIAAPRAVEWALIGEVAPSQRKADGEPWPGSQIAGIESEQQHVVSDSTRRS
jgi:hypothetical protein